MVKQHLKRFASPKTWSVKKKNIAFITRPNPGPHKMSLQMPINIILRDFIGISKSTKETKFILHNKDCLIDRTICHDYRRAAGLMDTLSILSVGEFYRVMINTKNKLYLVKIDEERSKFKLSKILSKTTIKGNKTQLNLSDGRNIILDDATKYVVNDTLKISLPEQNILEHFSYKIGEPVLLTSGGHVGEIGTIEDLKESTVTVKTEKGIFTTKKEFSFIVGKDKPVIKLD
jgi:small subunit ribosomal protein S4e